MLRLAWLVEVVGCAALIFTLAAGLPTLASAAWAGQWRTAGQWTAALAFVVLVLGGVLLTRGRRWRTTRSGRLGRLGRPGRAEGARRVG